MIVRIGQDHWRAKLTDHDVDLIRGLLAQRRAFVAEQLRAGSTQGGINIAMMAAGLSYRSIARKLECSESLVRAIAREKVRLFAARTCPELQRVGCAA